MSSPEERILALADFVDDKFKTELIRKSDVRQILLWAARAAKPDGDLEIAKSYLADIDRTLLTVPENTGDNNGKEKTLRAVK